MKNQKGITLVALVITIIVLIILAAVSINLVLGENGVMQRTQTGAQDYNRKAAQEALELKIAAIDMDVLSRTQQKTSLQELADALSQDDEVEYIELTSRVAATAPTVGDAEEIYTKLKAYSYEFGIDKNLKISKVNGVALENKNPENPSASNLKVGDIVSYNPSGTYNWNAEYATSYDTNSAEYASANKILNSASGQSFNINSWKVLSIKNGQVEMVPTAQTSGTVTLQGAQGYNNAVKLLNDACSSLYSDTSKEITARSISMDDIEKIIVNEGGYDPTTYVNPENTNLHYGIQKTASKYNKEYSYYPSIYASEKNSVIDGNEVTSGLGLSKQTSLIERTGNSAVNGYIQASTSIQPYQTYYNLINTDFWNYLGTYKDIILPNETSTTYWLASRSVIAYAYYCRFNVCIMNNGNLNYNWMFYSNNNIGNNSHALFPVVSLRIDNISGKNESGAWVIE